MIKYNLSTVDSQFHELFISFAKTRRVKRICSLLRNPYKAFIHNELEDKPTQSRHPIQSSERRDGARALSVSQLQIRRACLCRAHCFGTVFCVCTVKKNHCAVIIRVKINCSNWDVAFGIRQLVETFAYLILVGFGGENLQLQFWFVLSEFS